MAWLVPVVLQIVRSGKFRDGQGTSNLLENFCCSFISMNFFIVLACKVHTCKISCALINARVQNNQLYTRISHISRIMVACLTILDCDLPFVKIYYQNKCFNGKFHGYWVICKNQKTFPPWTICIIWYLQIIRLIYVI